MPIMKELPGDTKDGTVEDILDLLQEGDSEIIYSTNKDVILLLGTTGTGKTTFAHFIAGYDANLISEETGENTNEYIIIDTNGKIGNNTFVSQTIFPDLVQDTETNAVYYDCPGFSDTRSPAYDIAATFFIKKIIDHAERVKLVFTVNYPSVREGVDRQAFLTLVKNVVEMVKNVTKFGHSIALIVTKVDNIYDINKDENGQLIATLRSDESVIESIASFLIQCRDYLQSQISNAELDTFNENGVQFINALLQKIDNKYTHIGIFRRPDEAGVLTDIQLIQDRKPALKKIIHENIQFNSYEENDFGYTISSDSQNHLRDLIEKINENIAANITNIGQEIEEYYNKQEEPSRDIQDLYNKFRLGYDSLSATQASVLATTEPQQLLEMIIKNVDDLNISLSKENLQNIANNGEYLKFIKMIDKQLTAMKPTEWAQALTNVVGYLEDSQKWYNFLINFYGILSEYDVQRNYLQYSSTVDSLKYQITINENNPEIVLLQLKQFLDEVSKEDSDREYNNIKDIKPNKSKLKILTDLLDLTLKYNVEFSCDGNNLIIKGQYVRLSDTSSANCTEPKFVEIFALYKVFMDTNLNKTGDQVQFSIIAPKWDIIGNPTIILDGNSGAPIKPDKASNSLIPGGSGDDGKPGEPGGPTGHFLSVAQNVMNGEYFDLFIVGGKGGQGQGAGDGKEGTNGTVPNVPKKGSDPVWGVGFNVTEHINKTCHIYGLDIPQVVVEWNSRWEIQGEDCIDGGNGGDGGAGGKGGKSIDPVIINLNEDSKFVVTTSEGPIGDGGNEGLGAKGGSSGELLILTGHSSRVQVIVEPDPLYTYTVMSQEKLKQCYKGKDGVYGKHDENIKEPDGVVLSQLPSNVVNDYKNYLRDNLSNSILESYLRKFLDDLEHHESVEILYNVFGFVNEFQGLENQFYSLRQQISLTPFYKSLLNRINQYTDNLYEKDALTDDNKKVFSYLYTATLSKIYSINNNAGSNLIMDLPEYLKLRIEEINKLNDLSSITTINEEQAKYQKSILEKINEAQNFVESQINPEIDNIFYEIDHQMELLINEIIALENEAEEEKQNLEEQQRKLKDAITLKTILGIPKMASQFLSFLGPVGAAVGGVIGGGITLAESLVLDSSTGVDTQTLAALPAAVNTYMTKITEQLKDKQALFKEQLADAQQELKEFLDQLPTGDISDIENKITEIKNKLENEIAQGNVLDPESVDNMYNMREEIADLLEEKKKLLEGQKPEQDLNIDKQLRIVKRVQNIISMVQITVDFYNTIKNDQAKLNEMALAIQNAEEKIRELRLYEQSIYNTIIPICKDIQDKVNEMANNLQGKSHAALDISQWQIQSTLKDVKLEMQTMTQGFQIQEDLVRYLEKLEEGMTIMINMYDRIQDYRDKAELADYIANINSNKANQIQISDDMLRVEVDNLRQIIQSNRVLEKYETSMDAFRQHIFPFADYFISQFDLPSSLKSNDTSSLVATATDQISVLYSELIESKITITKYDKFIHSRIGFNSKEKQSSPFFVWKNNQYKNAITKLLEGKKITIKSDIRQGLTKNAIKFNTIGINFKLVNETLQDELNKELEDFKVDITHIGTSYYRCENEFYIISSDNQTIEYTFARNQNGDPKDSNDVYKKLEKYEPVLSPYTLWEVQLSEYNLNKNIVNLEKYKDEEMDLELEGTGQYVDRGIDVCNDELNKYYVMDDTISEIDNIDLSKKQLLMEIPIIKSFNTLSQRNTKHIERKRRSADKHQLAEDVKTNSFATSGACSNIKSAFINNIFNLIGSGLLAYEYMNPLKKIGQFFSKEEKHGVNEDFVRPDNSVVETMKWINIRSSELEQSAVSNAFINDESPTTDSLSNDVMFCNNGNLLLLDLVMRRKNGVKYHYNKLAVDQKIGSEFAQNLAYQAYAPKI